MKTLSTYCSENRLRLLTALLLVAGLAFGLIDPATAALGGFIVCDTQMDEILKKALAEFGVNLKTYSERMHEQGEELKILRSQIVDLAQKGAAFPGGGSGGSAGGAGELTRLVVESAQFKAFAGGNSPTMQIEVPARLLKTAILSETALTPATRMPIAGLVQERLLVRSLFREIPVASGTIEQPVQATETNAAGPQGGPSSPIGTGEGEPKSESSTTFTLNTITCSTIAHWIPASRQILSDNAMLQSFIEGRLLYGLASEVESELLTGSGAAGELDGLITQQISFIYGSTNLTSLDAIALAIGQLASGGYLASAVILDPADWFSSSFALAKTTTNEYLLGSPGSMTARALWGIPVILSTAMTAGQFLVVDTQQAGYIGSREQAVIRVSEHHSDYFTRNLIAILAEERLALVVERSGAVIGGSLSYTG